MVKVSLFRTKIDDCSEGPKAQEPTKRRRRSRRGFDYAQGSTHRNDSLGVHPQQTQAALESRSRSFGPSCCRYIGESGRY
jgi:hypothetical protein